MVSFQIIAVRGGNYKSDIAIDDIDLQRGPCFNQIFRRSDNTYIFANGTVVSNDQVASKVQVPNKDLKSPGRKKKMMKKAPAKNKKNQKVGKKVGLKMGKKRMGKKIKKG